MIISEYFNKCIPLLAFYFIITKELINYRTIDIQSFVRWHIQLLEF